MNKFLSQNPTKEIESKYCRETGVFSPELVRLHHENKALKQYLATAIKEKKRLIENLEAKSDGEKQSKFNIDVERKNLRLEKTINEVLDRIKMKFNDNLDVFLIGQLKREINISKDGKIIEWSSEEKFLTIFNEKLKNIDQLVGILQFFNLKFQIFDQNIQKQIIVIDNNENLKNKKDIIQKELISFREVTINQIVRILFLSCFVINYIL